MEKKIKEVLKHVGDTQLNLQCDSALDMLTQKIMNIFNEEINNTAKAAKQLKNIHPYDYKDE